MSALKRSNPIGGNRASCADSEEKHEPVSDIDTAAMDSLKVLDPNGRLEKRTY